MNKTYGTNNKRCEILSKRKLSDRLRVNCHTEPSQIDTSEDLQEIYNTIAVEINEDTERELFLFTLLFDI